jgi:hypothetical protein
MDTQPCIRFITDLVQNWTRLTGVAMMGMALDSELQHSCFDGSTKASEQRLESKWPTKQNLELFGTTTSLI